MTRRRMLRRCAFGVAGAAVAMASLARPAQATFPGANGVIAYTASDRATHAINPDGTGDRPLIADALAPQRSASGMRIAYASSSGSDLFIARADGTGARAVFGPPNPSTPRRPWDDVQSPAWSPGGRFLAFQGNRFLASGAVRTTVHRVATNGRRLRRLHQGAFPAWSPNGRVIAFSTRRRGGRWDLAAIRPDGRRLRILVRNVRNPVQVDFAPGGRRLAFLAHRRRSAPPTIAILNLRTRRVTRVPFAVTRGVNDAIWSPDGKLVAYLHDTPPPPGQPFPPTTVRAVNTDGTGNRRLFDLPSSSISFAWQPLPGR